MLGVAAEGTTVSSWRDHLSSFVLPPILRAALTCFVESGYHGTTIRRIATAAGLSVPGVYHHYKSKQALIVELMESTMADLYRRSIAALEEAGDSPVDQLRLHVECLVLFHANRQELAFIAANEIRSLEPTARALHIAARDRQQQILDRIVASGAESGAFTTEYPRDTTRAIVTLCTSVAQWYRPGGEITPEELAERYVTLVFRMLKIAAPE